MKKRLIALTLIVVMLTAIVFTCISCSTGLFEKDETRDYYQVIAKVTYGDLSKEIYKGQLATYVSSYGSTYINNYGMTLEEVVEYFYNTLTRSALLTLYAKYYVYEQAKAGNADYAYVDTTKSITELTDKDFVSLAQRIYAIDETNDDFMYSYESILSNLVKTTDTPTEAQDEDEETLTARTVRSYETDSSEFSEDLYCTSIAAVYGKQYEKTTYGQITEDFIKTTLGVSSIDEFCTKIHIYNVIDAKIKLEKDLTLKKDMKSALKTLKENVEKSNTGYDWFLEDKLNSCVVTSLREGLKKAESSTADEISARYKALIIDNLANYDEDTYSSAISGSTFMEVNAATNYAGVKSILLKFSDKQSAVLTALKTIYSANTDFVAELRDDMALGIDNPIINTYLSGNEGIKVNISDPLYDADNDDIQAAYTDKDVDYKVVLYLMAESIPNIVNEVVTKFKASDDYAAMTAEEKTIAEAIVTYSAKVEAFTQWIYLVNDDSGMFSSEAYTINPDGKDTSYVAEYTVLARKLATQAIGDYTYSVAGTAISGFDPAAVNYSSAKYSVDGTLTITSVAETTTTTATDPLKANIYTATTNNGNAISFIVNDYGIHIIMVTEQYGVANFGAGEVKQIKDITDVSVDSKYDDAYVYTLEAIYDRATSINYEFNYSQVATDATYVSGERYYTWDGDSYEYVNLFEFNQVATDATFDSTKQYYILNDNSKYEKVTLTAETFKPAETTYYTKDNTFDPAKTTYYTKALVLKEVKCEYQTVKDNLDDAIVTSIFTTKYSASQIALYLDQDASGRHAAIEKVEKIYDELIKQYNES